MEAEMGCVHPSLRGAFSVSVSNMSPLELIKLIISSCQEKNDSPTNIGEESGPSHDGLRYARMLENL